MHLQNRPSIAPTGLGVFLAACLGLPTTAPAAPGTPSQIPLFLATGAKPNIFFVLDDSGSMGSDILKSKGARDAHPVTTDVNDLDNDGNTQEVLYDIDGNMVTSPGREDQILEHCAGYNVLAYDPGKTYEPWEGVDENGVPYGDMTISAARNNPFFANATDISNQIYFPWTDTDLDGDYDVGECPTPDPAAYGGNIDASDCPAASCLAATDPVVDPINFANWYSYYRTRDHVQKAAVTSVVRGASVRMGIASLRNNIASGSGSPLYPPEHPATPVSEMSDTTSTSDCGGVLNNKECLLLRVSNVYPSGFTPLRRALDEAGAYFHQGDSLDHEYLGTAASPILTQAEHGDCQQNFIILVSDGFWNQSWPTTDSTGQVLASHGTGGDADSDGNHTLPTYDPPWDGGAQADGVGLTPPNAPASCTDSIQTTSGPITENTLADIAMHYYEDDLAPSLPDNVGEVPGIDENTQQHLVTFTVAFGVDGSLTSDPLDRTTAFGWPPICDNELWTIDDMRHAAWNSRGAFLSAGNPTTLGEAITNAVATVVDRTPTATVELNTSSLSTDTLIFLAMADSSNWSGDLLAYDAEDLLADIETDGTIDVTTPVWSAADVLNALDNTQVLDRVVITRGASGNGAAATWDNLSAAQQDDLKTDPSGVMGGDDAGRARLEYLLGDRSCEVAGDGTCTRDIDGNTVADAQDKSLRERDSRLGDIFNGAPLVVGIPARSWPSTAPFPTAAGETFDDFKTVLVNSPRTEVAYVGANDGMLHGFETATGREVLAYLPSSLASTATSAGYHRLSDPAYSHRYYVDQTPTVEDAYINTGDGGGLKWRTLAIGGLGVGGRGLYALDITDPTNFTTTNAANILLWEFTDVDDDELGLTTSKSTIAMMNNGKWAAIVGSGYNHSGTDPDANLFIIYLDGPTGTGDTWVEGTDYLKIETTDATATAANRNGLSTPQAADLDGNGTADRIYAGDLFGNVWVFDVSATTPTSWGIAQDSGGTSGPLFTAEVTVEGVTTRQPITVQPAISKHPTQPDVIGNQPNVMVYVGTGQYLAKDDLDTTDTQSFYGIWDSGKLSMTRTDLQAQTFTPSFPPNTILTDHTIDWGASEYGWYIDLPDTGERVVVNPLLRGGIVFFNSMIPSSNLCQGGGFGFLYTVDMENGGSPDFAAFDFNNDGVVDVNDVATDSNGNTENPSRVSFGGEVPTESVIVSNQQYTANSDGPIDIREVFEIEGLTGRLSWQELTTF